MTFLQGINHVRVFSNLHSRHFRKRCHICSKLWLLYIHGFVWTPCRYHFNFETAILCLLVEPKVINRVVCGAYTLNIIPAHKASCRIFRLLKFLITLVKYLSGCLWTKELVYSESCLQLQMCPMVEWIPECIWNSLCPFLEFLPVRSVFACTESLIHTIRSHCTPFIMVASKP